MFDYFYSTLTNIPMNIILEGLNPSQQAAVLHIEGPCMVIAGAGAGKTRVITSRIAYLLQEKELSPHQLLALTFTNKAAREMRERVEKIIQYNTNSLFLGTFHSIFTRILRKEATHLGYTSQFIIYDKAESQ